MEYAFLVVAAVWAVQFVLSYWQLRRFHQGISKLRRRGRCAVGMAGNRWQGRMYAVLVIDENECVLHAALFSGWTVFSGLRPVPDLNGLRIDAILLSETPVGQLRSAQWKAFQHAAQFFRARQNSPAHVEQPLVSGS